MRGFCEHSLCGARYAFSTFMRKKTNLFKKKLFSIGHVLVATKRCIPRVEDMTEEEKKDLFVASCKITKVLDEYYEAKSTTITIQDGEFAGQTVKHVHCHIMPRKPGDFENNDEIYTHLNKHDHKDVKEKRRALSGMIEEANIYKNLLK